ncbi:MAG TPA: DUF2251 domain-containing protein [Candidatus Acidoferrum sp.]|nr:DUF2251 domain-containing protein [Candidatus Acidoferrum sp.]
MNEELSELSYEEFIRARQRHWQPEVKGDSPDAVLPRQERVPLGEAASNFMLYAPGPEGFFAVFEDSVDTGWFYLYGVKQRAILKCTHIYNRSNFAVKEDEVDIGWAADGSACGLAVWGEFRAFLGVSKDMEIRKPVMNIDEDGIPAGDWPAGFDRYLETKID